MTDAKHEAPAEGAGEAMTEREVRQWIDACNHEPARQVLRDYLALRARSSAPEAREVRTHPTGEAIQDAVIAGFLHGVGMEPWDDMHDYIAVSARDYARGEPLPVRTAAPSADKLRFSPTHRHLGRGSTYEVIGEARLQQAGQFGPVEGDSITVYRGEDGQLWCRAQSEFEDGRFEALSTPDALKGDAK